MNRLSLWVLFGLALFAVSYNDVIVGAEVVPTESECRPYIEKAIHELQAGEKEDEVSEDLTSWTEVEEEPAPEVESPPESQEEETPPTEDVDSAASEQEDEENKTLETIEIADVDSTEAEAEPEAEAETEEAKSAEGEDTTEDEEAPSQEQEEPVAEEEAVVEEEPSTEDEPKSEEIETEDKKSGEQEVEETSAAEEEVEEPASEEPEEVEEEPQPESVEEPQEEEEEVVEEEEAVEEKASEEALEAEEDEESKSRGKRSIEDDDDEGDEKAATEEEEVQEDDKTEEEVVEEEDKTEEKESEETKASEEVAEEPEADTKSEEKAEEEPEAAESTEEAEETEAADTEGSDGDDEEEDTTPEDELLWEGEIPENLRDRKHINELLHLDDQFEARERAADRVAEVILRDIKKIYEGAIKPLETLYKYRDLSNRHFSDPEIFSKPLVVFMGPWSGGKSSTINYLTGNEYTQYSLRTGAEPSPAYFNILTWGNKTEILDGTQLAADYTFAGLQKFGQGLEDRLRGLKLPSKLLEKVNIVEIPGILEVRKQVQRLFPFNDACQWFIDRADMIVLMYDPAKLDAGPETEAILDQLKGREYQTRIILNKADTIHPEELLRVQSALIWNISPLMSSAQPPAMYTTSLWSHPYESGAPVRLLQAQERAFLRDLRTAVDKRIENRIASARRFAVRVRNHAKMVDCYLNTYYNHKTLFGNKKRISDEIIDNPQNYHIYEGLSTLTNISRYDLPDPEVYRDFFRLNPLFEFKKLSDTCSYFGGCPITKLDTAIAYDLPELVSKYKKLAEAAIVNIDKQFEAASQKDASKGRS